MGKSAFGTTGKYAAMYAFDGSNKEVPAWDYVAYPARGAMPSQFFGPRHAWSVSPNWKRYEAPDPAALKATIQAADAKGAPSGEPLKLDYHRFDTGGFGSGSALIFRPAALPSLEGAYVVTVKGLKEKGGTSTEIRYPVNFFSLQRAAEGAEGTVVYSKYFQKRAETIASMPDKVDQLEAWTEFLENEYLKQADPKIRSGAQKSFSELVKDPAVKREHDAAQKLRMLAGLEQKAGKSKQQLVPVALGYRDLAKAYKETRAAERAAADFERLKEHLQ
jgi:hypothetical protein